MWKSGFSKLTAGLVSRQKHYNSNDSDDGKNSICKNINIIVIIIVINKNNNNNDNNNNNHNNNLSNDDIELFE